MAKATIQLVLDTKAFIDEAQKVSKELDKALSIDPKGDEQIKQMKADLRSLTKENAKSVKESVDKFDQYGKAIDDVAKKATRLKELDDRLKEINKDAQYKTLKNDLSVAKVKENNGFDVGGEISDIQAKLKPYADEIANIKAESKQLNEELAAGLESLPVKLGEMSSEAQNFVDKGNLVNANGQSVSNLVSEIIGKQEEVNNLTGEQATEEQAAADATQQTADAQQQIIDAEKQVADESKEIDESFNRVGESAENAGTSTSAMGEGLVDAQSSAERMSESMEGVQASASDTQIRWVTVWRDIAKAAGGAFTKIYSGFQQVRAGSLSLRDAFAFINARKEVGALYQRLMELNKAKKDIESVGIPDSQQRVYAAVLDEIAKTKEQIASYKNEVHSTSDAYKAAEQAGKAFAKGTKNAINGLKKTIRGVGSVVKSLTKTIKSGFSSISKVVGKVRSTFDGMTRSIRSNMKHLITSLTKYILGFRSLFFLVRRLRKYIGEGIQNMAQFNEGNNHVNAGITNLLSSLLFLKNAWATAFSPIIQFVQQWLVGLIDTLAEVGNAFSRFIGRLLGVGTVFQAVKVDAADYAKSLDNVGGSSGGAADKTKKLTDRLAAFDDLNVLGKDNDPDSTGSGGGGGAGELYTPDPNEMFKLVDVSKDILDKIKDMWAKADFSEIGKTFRDKLVGALNNIQANLNDFEPVAYNIGKSIITFFNGALGSDALWVEVGQTIAQGLNTLGQFISGILENNEIDFGGGFAKLISSAFQDLDFATMQSNLDTIANELVDNINSFFTNLEFGEGVGQLSQSITSFLVTVLSGIEFTQIWETLKPIGTAILEGISQGLSTSDSPFATIIGELLTSIRDAIVQGDPTAFAEGITTFLINAVGSIPLQTIAEACISIGGAILDGIVQGLQNSSNPVLQSIGNIINQIADALPTLLPTVSAVFDVLLQLVNAVLPVINALLPVIADVITLLAPILQLIAEIITMLTPIITELVMAVLPVLQSVIETLLPYIQQIIDAILPVILQLLQDLQPTFDTIVTTILPIVVQLLDALMPILTIILGVIGDLIGPITQLLPPILELIGAILPPLIDFLAPIVKLVALIIQLVVDLLSPIIELIAPLIQMLTACLTPILEVLGFIGDLIDGIIIPLFGAFSGVIQGIAIPILKFLVLGFKAVGDVITNVGNLFKGFIDIWRTGAKTLGDILKNLVNKLLGFVDGFINYFINGINKAIDGINKLSWDVPDWVPVIGGQTWGFNLSHLSNVTIPRLAQGAVIPPNKEFMAVLGDQSHGTNIEAPLDTIKQAVAEVLANNNNQEVIDLLQQLITVVEKKELSVGDKAIGQANARYNAQQRLIRGTSF